MLTIAVTGTVAVAALALVGLSELRAATPPAKPTALVGGTLIDGTGGAVVRNSVVLLRQERIEIQDAFAERRVRRSLVVVQRPVGVDEMDVVDLAPQFLGEFQCAVSACGLPLLSRKMSWAWLSLPAPPTR